MENFESAYTALMDMVARPMSDTTTLNAAKREVNNAIRFLQRNHGYAYAERLTSFPYPANTLHVNLGEICGGLLRDIFSVQRIASGGTNGVPMRFMSYHQLQTIRHRYDRRTGMALELDTTLVNDYIEAERSNELICFLVGQSLGLYPKPQSEVNLLVHVHIWLAELVDNEDTNFFLDYAFDAVLTIALKRMQIYLKIPSQFVVSQAEVDLILANLVAWDGQVKTNPNLAHS